MPNPIFELNQKVDNLQKELGLVGDRLLRQDRFMKDMMDSFLERFKTKSNAAQRFRYDTATTNREQRYDTVTAFGGRPADKLVVLSVGGGSLQIQLPDDPDWIGLGVGDVFEDEIIPHFTLRTTSGATGTAVIRGHTYIGR